jgi:hypothetical protein
MSDRPEPRRLSTHLKHLEDELGGLSPAAFDVDDIVRGGRRRHRNRRVAQSAAAVAAVAVMSVPAITGAAGTRPGNDVPAATGGPKPTVSRLPLPTIDLADATLTYQQTGAVVTVKQKRAVVATVTLTAASYTGDSVHATVTVRSEHPVTVDTSLFTVFVDDGDVLVDKPRKSTLPAGVHTVVITATGIGSEPRGIGWTAGDGAQWIRE